jgi:SAGA-associated factor 73
VNPLDDMARETFATGRPLEDGLDSLQCKHCKKSILKTAAKAHLTGCLKAKREKVQRKKEQKEARNREKRAAGKEEERDDDGDTKMEDDDDDDDLSPDKKVSGGIKSAKKSAGKKVDLDEKKGKKRKAEGDAEKGPKQKKKKEEPKPKLPKQKGTTSIHYLLPPICTPVRETVSRVASSALSRLANTEQKRQSHILPPAKARSVEAEIYMQSFGNLSGGITV